MKITNKIVIALAAVASLMGKTWADDPVAVVSDGISLEQQFRLLPMSAKRNTGPLFWLHGDETPERLNTILDKVAEGGNGTFTAESRPHKAWLGEGWFRDLGICLDAAKRHDLHMWIFDEDWWPSQTVGGKVPQAYAAKKLVGTAVRVEPGSQYKGKPLSSDTFIACVAGRLDAEGAVEADTLCDLTVQTRQGHLRWSPPADGKAWQVMTFSWTGAPRLKQGNRLAVDGMSAACVAWFIKTVYQPHYTHFEKDFGKTIQGYFYDEPETPGDWGTDLNATFAAHGIPWMPCYVAWLFRLSGDAQRAAKYHYAEMRAETWGRVMFGGITAWCKQRGVASIGHFMEHDLLYAHNDYCAGDMMRLQKYSSMGGIDAVFDQFVMGRRDARDAPCWQTPKLASSISHVYAKVDDCAMCEIFGARGQDLTYAEMKWWADHMHVSGVNFLIPHSFNPRAPYDRDCPPYFYNGGFEPRYVLYRVWADYTSRLSLMLTGGHHVCPVAVLFSGNARQVGPYVTPEGFTTALQDALYDCDWLPFERFEDSVAKIEGNELRLHGERYRALVVPPSEGITMAALAKVKCFFDQGGTVIGYGRLPETSLTLGKGRAEIQALREAIWGCDVQPGTGVCRTSKAAGRSCFLPEKPTRQAVAAVLSHAGIAPVINVVAGETDGWIHALRRVDREGRDVIFVVNQNTNDAARTMTLQVPDVSGVPEIWDPVQGHVSTVPWRKDGTGVTFDLTLESNESALIRFAVRAANRPSRLTASSRSLTSFPVLPDAAVAPIVYPTARGADTTSPCKGAAFQGRVTLPDGALTNGQCAYIVCAIENSGAASNRLHIIRATYRARDGAGGADVTRWVKAQYLHDARIIPVRPDLLGGDPAYGHVKELVVDYECAGQRMTASACDGQTVTLCASAEPAAAVFVNGAYAGGYLGKPFRVLITQHLKAGCNTIRIEPFPVDHVKVEIF